MQYNSSPHSDGYPIGFNTGLKSPLSECVEGSPTGRSPGPHSDGYPIGFDRGSKSPLSECVEGSPSGRSPGPHFDGYPIGFDRGSKSPVSESVEGSPSGRSPGGSDEEMMITLASSRPKKPAGRKKFKETRHPVYRGVRKRNNDKWVCELREPNKKSRLWLGTYPTAEMAARAHDVAALALRGESGGPCLNFADSVWRLPVPVSREAEHIRRAAAEAAEAFRPLLPPAVVVVSPDVSRSDGVVEDFDMEELIMNMAEGPLLSPSPSSTGRGFCWEDVGSDVEVSLWS